MKFFSGENKHTILIITILIIIIVLWFLYKSNKIMTFAINKQLPGARTIYNILGRIEQQINPFIAFKYNLQRLKKSDIPSFYIQLSGNDLRFFDDIQKKVREGDDIIDSDFKTWREAEMTYNDEKYKIKIRVRGLHREHVENYKKSYKIKIIDNKNINGLTVFNLILPEDRFYYFGTLSYYLAKELEAPNLDTDFINLFFNGRIQGIYLFIEDINNKFIERHGFQSSSLFTATDDLALMPLSDNWWEELQNYENKQNDDYVLRFKDAQYFSEFLEVLETDPSEKIDIDEAVKFATIVSLYHDAHMSTGNAKYYLNGATGKIIPIIWDITLREMTRKDVGLDKELLDILSKSSNEIISLLFLDPEFLQLRNKNLYQLLSKIEDYINEMSDKFDPLFMSDTNSFYSYRRTKWIIDDYKRILENNINIFKEVLEYNEVYITNRYNTDSVDIDISVHNLSQIRLNTLKLNNATIKPWAELIIHYLNGKQKVVPIKEKSISLDDVFIYPYLDESFLLQHPSLRISLKGVEFNDLSIDNIQLEMINDISNTIIDQKQIKYGITSYYTKAIILDEKQLKRKGINYWLKDNHLTIYPGVYVFRETYRIPFKTTINSGTVFLLGPKASLVFEKSLFINGSAANPVIVKNIEEPFGSFAFVGQSDSSVSVSFLDLSGGSESYVDGVFFSGAFSIHYAGNVEIKNSSFYNNHADDGLNIKYSHISLKNNNFNNNYADQVDLDFCNGIVNNNQFNSPKIKNDNGDGLDISGSFILVEKNFFNGFGDKGISIGEDSEVYVMSSVISNNNLGAAVKDSSIAYFYNNQWEGNNIDISAYQKKDIFDGGTVVLNKERKVKLDKKSQLNIESVKKIIEEIYDEFLSY